MIPQTRDLILKSLKTFSFNSASRRVLCWYTGTII